MRRHDERAWRQASTPPPGYRLPEVRSAKAADERRGRLMAAVRALLLRRREAS